MPPLTTKAFYAKLGEGTGHTTWELSEFPDLVLKLARVSGYIPLSREGHSVQIRPIAGDVAIPSLDSVNQPREVLWAEDNTCAILLRVFCCHLERQYYLDVLGVSDRQLLDIP